MKKGFSTLGFLLLAGGAAHSQWQWGNNGKPAISGRLGIGTLLAPKPGIMTSFGITAVRETGWGLHLSWQIAAPTARNLPADYRVTQLFFTPSGPPKDILNIVSLSAIRKRSFRRNNRAGWSLNAGPALVTVRRMHFLLLAQRNPYSKNYEDVTNTESTVGLQLGLNTERMYGQSLALGAGLWANLNPDYPALGLEVHLLFGSLR